MTLWIILALMTAAAAVSVCLPLLRQSRGHLVIGLAIAALFAIALGGLYPMLGRPELAGVRPPPTSGPAVERPDPELAKDLPLLEARMHADPNDPRGWRLLGMVYTRMGRFSDALAAYGHAIDLDPGKPEDLSSQGEALVQAANGVVTPGARRLFSEALALDPADPRSRYFLAMAKDEDGDHKGAMADWIALIKSAPPDAPWLPDMRAFVSKVAAQEGVDLGDGVGAPAAPDAQSAMIQSMVERLAARLKTQPRDEDGWVRLMRSRMVLGNSAAAGAALRDGLAAFANSPQTQDRLRAAAKGMSVPGA